MLTVEDNELLTRVGPGTPMGRLMRQYWVPALLSSELSEPDGPPVRVLLLGERLIGFRTANGEVGLIQDHCPHRGASLFLGRNEDGGLRCVYHGWKFDIAGRCVDMPTEATGNRQTEAIGNRQQATGDEAETEAVGNRQQATGDEADTSALSTEHSALPLALAYPCRERNGIVWAYLGPRATPPPLPDLEANMLPQGQWTVTAIQRECNWLQALEGDIDTSHAGLLHFGSLAPESQPRGTFSEFLLRERAPRYAVLDTDGGTTYGAYREAQPGYRYWRIAHFLLPFYGMPPQGLLGAKIVTFARVPMDDTHTLTFNMMPRLRPGAAANPASHRLRNGGDLLPNSTDWYGRFRLAANSGNDYQLDRPLQRANHGPDGFSGIRGVGLQDQAVTESQGAIAERTQEHLGSSDAMVIRVRRRLLEAVNAFAEHGVTPPGVDNPDVYRVRAGGVFLPEGADWIEATRELRQAFVSHDGLDLAVTGPIAAGEFNGRTD